MKKLKDLRILVFGDIMLDRYINTSVNRISPEAPVPVAEVISEEIFLGGCGNVIRNIKSIGVTNITCCTAMGYDPAAVIVLDLLKDLSCDTSMVKTYNHRVTTEKIRIISNDTQLLRIDREKKEKIIYSLLDNIEDNYDIIVISDYNKGVVTHSEVQRLILKCPSAKIIADIKPINVHMYNGIYAITPNENEFLEIDRNSYFPDCKYIFETMGKEGIAVYRKSNNETDTKPELSLIHRSKLPPVKVYNVIGAGDTVVAVLSVCIGLGLPEEFASDVAVECSRYVVTQPGTSCVPWKVFKGCFNKDSLKDFL